ncbi:ABC-type uncharacterized transport system ATPase subunit [Arthrobacter ulcerisalmonis]|nr:ABC-type uncharacterized transport system ATPase subunit [Arthrobacter ulcerisalmonis]
MDFGDTTVIRDLFLTSTKGRRSVSWGRMGPGRPPTLLALPGTHKPAAGTLHIGGKVFEPSDGARLGYLREERGLYEKEAALDVMTYFGRLTGLFKPASRSWSENYLERVRIPEEAKARLDKLSGGQQQKVQLGVTIMNNPELLILDEPTKGLDPVNRRLLKDIIEEHKPAGVTVIMVTHQMEEVERLCDGVILLKDGASREAPDPR